MSQSNSAFNTLILKIASRCNIDCSYCYEYNRGDSSWKVKPKRLSIPHARLIGERIAEFCQHSSQDQFTVVFHGGEPLLVGPKYLQQLIYTIKNEVHGNVEIRFGLQTNGLLVSEEYIDLFLRNRVAVGVSLDGDEYANRKRVDKKGMSTFELATQSVRRLKRAGCLAGVQAVIDLWSTPETVLKCLADLQPPLIELSQPLGSHDNNPFEISPPISLGDWLVRAYQFWETDENMRGIKIAVFTEVVRTIIHGKGASDWFPGLPPNYLLVGSDGYYEGLDTLKVADSAGRELGLSICEHSIIDALSHPFISFRGSENALPDDCRSCPISDWCCGGSYPSRHGRGNGFNNSSIYCRDMKKIFLEIGSSVLRNDSNNLVPEPANETLRLLRNLREGIV